jgi:hypothetical protein
MRIVNPSFGLPEAADNSSEPAIAGAADWGNDPIAIISNSKPNARELLEGVRDQLGAFRATDNIDYLFKDSAAQPAPLELIEQVAGKYKGAILALAD